MTKNLTKNMTKDWNQRSYGTRAARLAAPALTALLAVLTTGAAPASPAAETGPPGAGFDFGACPAADELPAGADPGTWRCEVMRATGRLRIGGVDEPVGRPMTLTFAEGRVDGAYAQVFGELTAEPIRVGGTPLTLTPRYGGYSDFESDDLRRGELDLTLAVGGPLLPKGCSIGAAATEPIHLVLKDTRPTEVISEDPPVVSFGAADTEFAAPRTDGCGRPGGRILDRVLDLPAPAGENRLELDATVALRPYA
ncbi:hypothetical protein O7599_19340 [Streptomyces sp. WMMC500]|uniref:hypothetical protein n=1 Tax=Streptomyces sp. WMMC500 TaxID=3015154 RepID=UPI00248B31CA|nr:hypothetical protein [Streptomyces sp. WMMC500]WBB57836.1 hypothetical protein O7599_19340 [Streptomyces sp. WMMC500]